MTANINPGLHSRKGAVSTSPASAPFEPIDIVAITSDSHTSDSQGQS